MMFCRSMSLSIAFTVSTCILSVLTNNSAVAQAVAVVEGPAHAKGVVLLRATIPSDPCPRYTTLRVSDNHREDQEQSWTATIYGAFIQSAIIDNEACSLLVPAFAGPNDYHQIGFAFSHPGTYEVRWQFGSTGTSPVDPAIEHTVRIERSTDPDLTFLAGFADADLMRAMFGADFFERQTGNAVEHYADPDVRALKVIGRLLYATRGFEATQVVAWYGPKGDVQAAAAKLLALSREHPDSSYAPYAAYYAGLCNLAKSFGENAEKIRGERKPGQRKNRGAEFRRRATLIQNDPRTAKAAEAFEFAIEHADAFLKPRAMYQYAFLRGVTGDLDKCEEDISVVEVLTTGSKDFREAIVSFRRDFARIRKAAEQHP